LLAAPGWTAGFSQNTSRNRRPIVTAPTHASAFLIGTQALADRPISIPARGITVTLGKLYRLARAVPSRARLRRVALIAPLLFMTLLHGTVAKAQSEWSVGFGASLGNPTLIGTVTRRPSQFATVGAGWTMHDGHFFQIKWTPELVPLFLISEPHQDFFTLITQNAGKGAFYYHVFQGPRTIYGAGATPLKWRFEFFPKLRLVPFVEIGAGFIETTAEIPYQGPIGTKFNYNLDVGGGASLRLPNGKRLMIGVEDRHMSNLLVSNGLHALPGDPGDDFVDLYLRLLFHGWHKPHHRAAVDRSA